ncbi:MAG TPA: isochorismatase family protein [Ilumatobacteraceae bacterium]
MTSALLVIDAQVNMFWPDPAHDSVGLLGRLSELVATAHDAGVPVVFIRNNGSGDDPDIAGTPGWEIAPSLQSELGAATLDKTTSDAFASTALATVLRDLDVDTVVIAGLQSEHCVSATARGAAVDGFDVVVVGDAHSTYDGRLKAVDVIAAVNADLASIATISDTAAVLAGW